MRKAVFDRRDDDGKERWQVRGVLVNLWSWCPTNQKELARCEYGKSRAMVERDVVSGGCPATHGSHVMIVRQPRDNQMGLKDNRLLVLLLVRY